MGCQQSSDSSLPTGNSRQTQMSRQGQDGNAPGLRPPNKRRNPFFFFSSSFPSSPTASSVGSFARGRLLSAVAARLKAGFMLSGVGVNSRRSTIHARRGSSSCLVLRMGRKRPNAIRRTLSLQHFTRVRLDNLLTGGRLIETQVGGQMQGEGTKRNCTVAHVCVDCYALDKMY